MFSNRHARHRDYIGAFESVRSQRAPSHQVQDLLFGPGAHELQTLPRRTGCPADDELRGVHAASDPVGNRCSLNIEPPADRNPRDVSSVPDLVYPYIVLVEQFAVIGDVAIGVTNQFSNSPVPEFVDVLPGACVLRPKRAVDRKTVERIEGHAATAPRRGFGVMRNIPAEARIATVAPKVNAVEAL